MKCIKQNCKRKATEETKMCKRHDKELKNEMKNWSKAVEKVITNL